MKKLPGLLFGLLLLIFLTGCEQIALTDRPYQTVAITDFSRPTRAYLSSVDKNVISLSIYVSGSISKPVALKIIQRSATMAEQEAKSIRLEPGTYKRRNFTGDFYASDALEMLVTGQPGTTGSLTIEWYR